MQNGHSNGASHGQDGTQVGRGAGDYAEVSMSVPVSTALSSSNPAIVPACAKDIARLGETFSSTDSATRQELLRRSRELVLALETPRETMIRHCWAEVSKLVLAAWLRGWLTTCGRRPTWQSLSE